MSEYACRFYEAELPGVDDCVMAQVIRIESTAVYVVLTEYNNAEGMIQLAELSKRRIRSIAKLVRVGKFEVVSVVRVDPERGHLDLSKRRVSKEDLERCQERFSQAKVVHTIMRHCSNKLNVTTEEMCRAVAWKLDTEYKSAFEAFKLFVQEGIDIFGKLELPKEWLPELSSAISRRLISQPGRMTATVDVRSNSYEGVENIKAALKCAFGVVEQLLEEDRAHRAEVAAAEEAAASARGVKPEDMPDHVPLREESRAIQVKLIAPPVYLVSTAAYDRREGIKTLDRALEAIEEGCGKHQCEFVLKKKPEVVADESSEEEEVETESDSNSEPDEDLDTMGAAGVDLPE